MVGWSEMDIERLWEILDRERRKKSLQALPENFFEEVRAYLRRLDSAFESAEDERRREFLRDERRNARMRVEDIVRLRVGKIVRIASSGSKTEPKELLPAEREIYIAVRTQVEDYMRKILKELLGEEEAAKTMRNEASRRGENEAEEEKGSSGIATKRESDSREVAEERQPKEEGKRGVKRQRRSSIEFASFLELEDNNEKSERESRSEGGEERNESESREMTEECREVVRILTEIPSFLGTDGRTYRLHREDVVVLPRENAEILCGCLLYTSPSPRDRTRSRMPSSA